MRFRLTATRRRTPSLGAGLLAVSVCPEGFIVFGPMKKQMSGYGR